MRDTILYHGEPPLTVEAADAALDLIHFISTAVWGVDGIHVTNAVRPLWRSHLAAWFPQLPVETQYWYANAPMTVAAINSQWALLNPWQRNAQVQQWAMELPSMLWMLEPVLAQAHQEEAQEHVRGQIAEWRQRAAQAPQAQQVQSMSSAEAIAELQRRSQQAAQLSNFNTNMTNMTINMIRSK
jgi:hypothetical protein